MVCKFLQKGVTDGDYLGCVYCDGFLEDCHKTDGTQREVTKECWDVTE